MQMRLYLIDDLPGKQKHLPMLIDLLGNEWVDGFKGQCKTAHLDGSLLYNAVIDPSSFCLIDLKLPYGDPSLPAKSHKPTIDKLTELLQANHPLWDKIKAKHAELQSKSLFCGDRNNYLLASWLLACRIISGQPYIVVSTQRDNNVGYLQEAARQIHLPHSSFPIGRCAMNKPPPVLVDCAKKIHEMVKSPYCASRHQWNGESLEGVTACFTDPFPHKLSQWTENHWRIHGRSVCHTMVEYFRAWNLQPAAISSAYPNVWPLICGRARYHGNLHRSLTLGVFEPAHLDARFWAGAVIADGSQVSDSSIGELKHGRFIQLTHGYTGGEVIKALEALKAEGWSFLCATEDNLRLVLRLIGLPMSHDQTPEAIRWLEVSAENYKLERKRPDAIAKTHTALDRLRASGVLISFTPTKAGNTVEMQLEFTETIFD